MTQVYVVTRSFPYAGSQLEAVFSTAQKADAYCEKVRDDNMPDPVYIYAWALTVDEKE